MWKKSQWMHNFAIWWNQRPHVAEHYLVTEDERVNNTDKNSCPLGSNIPTLIIADMYKGLTLYQEFPNALYKYYPIESFHWPHKGSSIVIPSFTNRQTEAQEG